MLWVVIIAVIALLGVVMVVGYARWLWHKASDLMAEVTVVTDRLGQLGDLLGRIQPPSSSSSSSRYPSATRWADEVGDEGEGDEDDDWSADARALRLAQESAVSSAPTPVARHARQRDSGADDVG